jgi:hypothetical protein
MTKAKRRHSERGYIMMVVLVLITVLTAAGVFALRSSESEIRAASMSRRAEVTMRAAEAGVAERLEEIRLASLDASAALESNTTGVRALGWQQWPPASFSASTNEISNGSLFQVDSAPLVAVEASPPAGVQIGSGGQFTLWQVDAFALENRAAGVNNFGGQAQQVSVGVSLWSRGGMSYNR